MPLSMLQKGAENRGRRRIAWPVFPHLLAGGWYDLSLMTAGHLHAPQQKKRALVELLGSGDSGQRRRSPGSR
jgi:hypothetical protein